jgi:hypothetical protein
MACVGTGRLLVADTGWHALAVKALPKLEMRWWTAAPAERECRYAGWLAFVRSDTEAIGSGAIVGARTKGARCCRNGSSRKFGRR